MVFNPARDVFWCIASCTCAPEQAVTRSVVAWVDSIWRNVLFGGDLALLTAVRQSFPPWFLGVSAAPEP
jgi:hypothetical protein